MLCLFLALHHAEAKEPKAIQVPGIPVSVKLPEADEETGKQPWGHTLGDATTEIKLSMRNGEKFATVTFQNTDYQPSLDALMPNLVEELFSETNENTALTPGEPEKIEHPTLGEAISIPLKVRDNFMEQDLWGRAVFFPVEGTGVLVTAITSKEEPEHLEEVMAEVLGMIEVEKKPVPEKDLPYKLVTADAGYTVELPTGWRALTVDEARQRSTVRIAGEGHYSGKLADLFVVDTAHLSELVFNCLASSDGTLEVVDPTRSSRAKGNFLTLARVSLKGGRYRFVAGTEERFIDVTTETSVTPEGEGKLEMVNLPDREAYLFSTDGKLYDEPVDAAVFYTAFDNVSLMCMSVAEADDTARLGSFEKVMKGMSVVDGLNHPMHFSLKARYIRWWPTTNPVFQLYWLPIPVLLLGSWLIFKD